ncbi:MAG: helix-turn-helix transcriptional regulator, partial [Spirochaetes bacterium]|nr:helix-turn-helix transcriptional regulator [Spirochaetota bacterium]
LNIKFINERIKNLLEISKSNLKLNDLILEYDIFINKLKTLNYSRQESLFQVSFINKSGYNIASKINLSILIDEYQDTTGYLIIGRIIQNHSSFINKYKISKREFEIVKMLMSGLSNKNIANYLKISERTIKAHITNIYNKMGINSKMELFNIFNSYIN